MKTCVEVYKHICDNLDRELDSPECREIRRHIGTCPECRAYLDSMKQTVVLYRSIPTPGVPRSLHSRIMKSIPIAPPPRRKRAASPRRKASPKSRKR
jgi:anti-sigma factor (TIGR02949 family)